MRMLMVIWRRKTDPKTGKHTLRERSQSKATWTCQKSNFALEFTRKMPGPNPGTPVFCEPAQSKRTWTFHKRFHKSHFVQIFFTKKRAWTCHKSNFVGKFTGKICTLFLGSTFCMEIYKKNAHGHCTRAILCGNLQEKLPHTWCGHTVWGKMPL